MKLVSVIIPCFNAQDYIREALDSALSQDIGDLEVIVIDDGSTDSSAEIVQKLYPAVKLIRTINQGASKARNLGTKESEAKFIQYLDADDVLAPGKIKEQAELLEKSGADIAYGNWKRVERKKDGKFVESELIRRRLVNPEIELFTDFWCPPNIYLFRREIIERVHGWNEGLPIIQDARLLQDCALRGARFVYIDKLMGLYRVLSKHSLSHRDSVAFNKEVFKNAAEIEAWWVDNGGINTERLMALLEVYGYVASTGFKKDPATFEAAYQTLERLSPGYIPKKPGYKKLISRLFGYRRAESVSYWLKITKASVRKMVKGS